MEQEKDICAACLPGWPGDGRRLRQGMLAALWVAPFSRAPTQTDRQAAAAAPAAATVPAGVHGSNITQQKAIKHFVATRSCEQQMLIKGVWLGVANKGGMWAASFVGLSTHTHTHTPEETRIQMRIAKRNEKTYCRIPVEWRLRGSVRWGFFLGGARGTK